MQETDRSAGAELTQTGRGFKKTMWLEWRLFQTRSSCDDQREGAFTHKHRERTASLDYILGPRTVTCTSYIHNEVKLCSTWDHRLVYAFVQEEGHVQSANSKKRRERAGWMLVSEEGKIEFKTRVMGANGADDKKKASVRSRNRLRRRPKPSFTSRTPTRHNVEKNTPEEVATREKALPRSERPRKRRFLRKRAAVRCREQACRKEGR